MATIVYDFQHINWYVSKYNFKQSIYCLHVPWNITLLVVFLSGLEVNKIISNKSLKMT